MDDLVTATFPQGPKKVRLFQVGGFFTNPFEEYAQVKMGNLPQRYRGETSKIYQNHQLLNLQPPKNSHDTITHGTTTQISFGGLGYNTLKLP